MPPVQPQAESTAAMAIDTDTTNDEILLAATNHDVDSLQKLLKVGSAKIQDPDTGYSPFHAAIASCEGDEDMTEDSEVNGEGDALHSNFKGLPNVVGIRTLGLAGAVELSPIVGTPGKRAFDIFMDCFHQGVLVRPAAENIVICPPFIVEKEHIERIVNVVGEAIRKNA